MDHCMYCEKNETLDSYMLPICSLEYSQVYLLKNQNYPGRCVVAFNRHKREIFELERKELHGFFDDVSTVAAAIQRLFFPDKLNYGIYGDIVSHFHCHIVPKTEGDFAWGIPFSMDGNAHFPDTSELKRRAEQIRDCIASMNSRSNHTDSYLQFPIQIKWNNNKIREAVQ
ncbi:HIT family protein [Marasmitruncus massiliensis]|uniref:HIT family protein n=1 Tax=Marasmitruncus massiliensis TaxID=1944642 RepID=UPI000C79B900|nr:HIT family protein [Marasmitruncus massiliensis]